MRIGIDIDDTLTHFNEYSLPFCQKYDYEVLKRNSLKNINGYDTQDIFNWSEEEDKKFWELYIEEICSTIPLRNFAKEVIQKWKDEGHEIYIITARSDKSFQDPYLISKNWLDKNEIPYDGLFVNCKTAESPHEFVIEEEITVKDEKVIKKLKGRGKKYLIAQELKLDYFIDDLPKNCESVANLGVTTFLMDTVFNKDYTSSKITRVYSWPEISFKIANSSEK